MRLNIVSGHDQIWLSSQCPDAIPVQDVVVRYASVTQVPVVWTPDAPTRSAPTGPPGRCPAPTTSAPRHWAARSPTCSSSCSPRRPRRSPRPPNLVATATGTATEATETLGERQSNRRTPRQYMSSSRCRGFGTPMPSTPGSKVLVNSAANSWSPRTRGSDLSAAPPDRPQGAGRSHHQPLTFSRRPPVVARRRPAPPPRRRAAPERREPATGRENPHHHEQPVAFEQVELAGVAAELVVVKDDRGRHVGHRPAALPHAQAQIGVLDVGEQRLAEATDARNWSRRITVVAPEAEATGRVAASSALVGPGRPPSSARGSGPVRRS